MPELKQQSLKAKREFYTDKRGYKVGDVVDPADINLNMKTMCFASGIIGAESLPKFKVTLNANGGTGDDIVAETESLFQLPNCTFTAPENKEFKGWSADKSGTGGIKAIGDNCSVVQDTTYYAIWQNIKVTIKFNANGGTGSMVDVKQDKGSEYTLPACTFTAPQGKVFTGWSLDKSAIVTKITAADVTVYAVWQDAPAEPEADPKKKA